MQRVAGRVDARGARLHPVYLRPASRVPLLTGGTHVQYWIPPSYASQPRSMRATTPLARITDSRFVLGSSAILFALGAGGCGGGGGPTGPPPVQTVSVSLSKSSLFIGETANAVATLKDGSGNVLSGRVTSWSSTDPGTASVTAQGMVTAVGVGSTTITATSEGHTGSASVSVTQIPVASVSVTLASTTLLVGSNTQATAILRDANGGVLARSTEWSSDNTAVATVTPNGRVTALAIGSANITATSEGHSGSATLTVVITTVSSVSVALDAQMLAPGSRTQATATPKDASGTPLIGKQYAWSSDNPSVATVTAQGVVTAVATGTANIVATVEGTTGSGPLTVAASAGYGLSTEKIRVVNIGTTFTPTLSGAGAGAATFASRATSVATVNAQGVITGVGEGQVWVAATAPGFAPDSVYVIVPRNTTGPLLRADLTNYIVTAGTRVTVNIILDTRSTPIGGTELSVGYTTSPVVFVSPVVTAMGSPAPVISITQRGVFRVSLASGNSLSGQLTLVQFTFDAPVTSGVELLANRSGYLILTLLDIVNPTGGDLLPVSTSTRVPVIIQ